MYHILAAAATNFLPRVVSFSFLQRYTLESTSAIAIKRWEKEMVAHEERRRIASIEELDDQLTTPSKALITDMSALDGDLMIIGAAGKMGPTLSVLAQRTFDAAADGRKVTAVARFSDASVRDRLEAAGVTTIAADLHDPVQLARLPEAGNIVYMLGTKFGTTGAEHQTWATNTYLAGRVAERFPEARWTVFSSGNVYPLRTVVQGAADESVPPNPVGEYAQTCLARERLFEHVCRRTGMPLTICRLNYAIDLRYGVLHDIASHVHRSEAVDVSMGNVNVIWQGDANMIALRALRLAGSPPTILNVTGPETISVRWLVEQFSARFRVEPKTIGEEAETALLSNAAASFAHFGYPSVPLMTMLDWMTDWIERDMPTLNKPTHFQEREGKF
jgi:nucleoside-diphosphate-sugar epimerase